MTTLALPGKSWIFLSFPLVPAKEGLVFLLPGDRNSFQLLSVKGFSEVSRLNLSQERQGEAPSPGLTTAVVLSQQPFKGRRRGFRVQELSYIYLTKRTAPHTLIPQLCPQMRQFIP